LNGEKVKNKRITLAFLVSFLKRKKKSRQALTNKRRYMQPTLKFNQILLMFWLSKNLPLREQNPLWKIMNTILPCSHLKLRMVFLRISGLPQISTSSVTFGALYTI
jgi:hypothetical protein